MSNQAKGFSPKDAKRVARTVQRVESTPWSGDPRRSQANSWNPGVLRAKCTTAITTGTWSTPGTGAVQLYHRDQSTGDWEASGDPVDVNNQFSLDASVAVNAACFVAWISGEWWLVNAECP